MSSHPFRHRLRGWSWMHRWRDAAWKHGVEDGADLGMIRNCQIDPEWFGSIFTASFQAGECFLIMILGDDLNHTIPQYTGWSFKFLDLLVCLFLGAMKGAGQQYLGVNWSEHCMGACRKRRFPIQLVSQLLWRVTMQRGQPQRSAIIISSRGWFLSMVWFQSFTPCLVSENPHLPWIQACQWVCKSWMKWRWHFCWSAHVRWSDVHVEDRLFRSFTASGFRALQCWCAGTALFDCI